MGPAYSVVDARELAERGWTRERLFDAVSEVDRSIYGPDLPPAPPEVRELFLRKYDDYPETSHLLVEAGGAVCGYLGLVPLTEDAFDLLCRGAPSAEVLTPHRLAKSDHVGALSGYVSGIAITPRARCHRSARLLLASIPRMLDVLAGRGFRVRRLGAHVWTQEGERLCERLGMDRVLNDTPDGPFYSAPDFRLPDRPLFSRGRLAGPHQP